MTQRLPLDCFGGKSKMEVNQISLFANANDENEEHTEDFRNGLKNNKNGQAHSPRPRPQRERSLELRLNKDNDYGDGTFYTQCDYQTILGDTKSKTPT